jgi:hypothetical protein
VWFDSTDPALKISRATMTKHEILEKAWIRRCQAMSKGFHILQQAYSLRTKAAKELFMGSSHDERYRLLTYAGTLFSEGHFIKEHAKREWADTVRKTLGKENKKQKWMCGGKVCLLMDGSMWEVIRYTREMKSIDS